MEIKLITGKRNVCFVSLKSLIMNYSKNLLLVLLLVVVLGITEMIQCSQSLNVKMCSPFLLE